METSLCQCCCACLMVCIGRWQGESPTGREQVIPSRDYGGSEVARIAEECVIVAKLLQNAHNVTGLLPEVEKHDKFAELQRVCISVRVALLDGSSSDLDTVCHTRESTCGPGWLKLCMWTTASGAFSPRVRCIWLHIAIDREMEVLPVRKIR